MAREQKGTQKRSDASLLDRRSYLQLAGSAVAAVASGSAGAVAQTDSDNSSPTIDRFDISKSSQLGSNQMFSVQWGASAGDEDLDVVEVVVNGSNTDLDLSVQDVSGASASGWELFQFPLGTALDVHVRAKDLGGNVTKKSKTINLGEVNTADIHLSFDDSSDLDTFTEVNYDHSSLASAPDRNGKALKVQIDEGDHYGCSRHLGFGELTGDEPIEAVTQFDLFVPESFQYADAGPGSCKLGGFAGTYDEAGWGDHVSDGTNGWSSRMHVCNPDRTGVYSDLGVMSTVHHASGGLYGEEVHWDIGIDKGKWYTFKQYVKMNTPGANDGIVRGWIDDELAYERTDFLFREEGYEYIKIQDFWLNVYHGGSWTSPTDTAIYWDDLKINRDASSF